MIHGYHVIFGAYGFWLPNDPRGSWFDFVAAWDLLPFGPAAKGLERKELSPELEILRMEAKKALKYPAPRSAAPRSAAPRYGSNAVLRRAAE